MSRNPQHSLRFLPVGLSVEGRDCLIVGGGNVGERKVQNLLRAGGVVTVVAPSITPTLSALAGQGKIRWIEELFHEEQLGNAFLVVAATDDETLNAKIVAGAARCGALACDASSAERSQVIFGALLYTSDATVAVFTDGHDPTRARRLRDHIGKILADNSDGALQK